MQIDGQGFFNPEYELDLSQNLVSTSFGQVLQTLKLKIV